MVQWEVTDCGLKDEGIGLRYRRKTLQDLMTGYLSCENLGLVIPEYDPEKGLHHLGQVTGFMV